MKRGWTIALLALLAAAGVYFAAAKAGEGRWTQAERRELVFGIPFEGQLVALENVELGPPSGAAEDVWQFTLGFVAIDGKEVKEGEPVLGFDPSELEKRLEDEVARRDEAEKNLEKRSIEIEGQRRDRRLQLAEAEAKARKGALGLAVPPELLSRRELDTARIDQGAAVEEVAHRREALAALDRAEQIELASLREQAALAADKVEGFRQAIAAMTVVAPRSGTVIVRSRNNSEERFKSGDTVWRADKVVQIPNLASLRARVEIDEALGARVEVGQRASYFLDAHPDRALAGKVEAITQSVQRRSWMDPSKILKVTVTVEQDAATAVALRPGMRLRGQIETGGRAAVLAIAEEAVQVDGVGVYVEARGAFGTRRLRPQLGRRSQGYFEVLGGLDPGQQLRLPALPAGGGA